MAAYSSWEELTHAEGAAIAHEDWAAVHQCQHTKQGLQKQIIHLTEAAQAECRAAGRDRTPLEQEVRRVINTLITLESRNATALASRQQAAAARRLELDHASHNLRRVQKSYAPPTGALWNSYS
jgi:hypothetical protein